MEVWSDGEHYVLRADEIDELWRRTDDGEDKWDVIEDICDRQEGGA